MPVWGWGVPGCLATFMVLPPPPVSPAPGHLDALAHLFSLQGEFDKDLL